MRDAILDAAIQVFLRAGVHKATINEIAIAAGLGKGTLYLYFENKEALNLALVERIFEGIEARLLATGDAVSLSGFVEQLGRAVEVPAIEADFIRVFFEMFSLRGAADEVVRNVAARFDHAGQHIAQQLKHLQLEGEVAPHHDANAAGRALIAMLDGLALHRGLFKMSSRRYQAMIREVLEIFEAGLRS